MRTRRYVRTYIMRDNEDTFPQDKKEFEALLTQKKNQLSDTTTFTDDTKCYVNPQWKDNMLGLLKLQNAQIVRQEAEDLANSLTKLEEDERSVHGPEMLEHAEFEIEWAKYKAKADCFKLIRNAEKEASNNIPRQPLIYYSRLSESDKIKHEVFMSKVKSICEDITKKEPFLNRTEHIPFIKRKLNDAYIKLLYDKDISSFKSSCEYVISVCIEDFKQKKSEQNPSKGIFDPLINLVNKICQFFTHSNCITNDTNNRTNNTDPKILYNNFKNQMKEHFEPTSPQEVDDISVSSNKPGCGG